MNGRQWLAAGLLLAGSGLALWAAVDGLTGQPRNEVCRYRRFDWRIETGAGDLDPAGPRFLTRWGARRWERD